MIGHHAGRVAAHAALMWLVATGCHMADNPGQVGGVPAGAKFVEYVKSFEPKPPEGCHVPVLVRLPEDVYQSSLSLAQTDDKAFRESVCLYLLKYQRYYMENCHQAYSLVDPEDRDFPNPLDTSNSRFYILNRFMAISGYKVEREDLFPSNSVTWYLEKHPNSSPAITAELERIRKMVDLIEKGRPRKNAMEKADERSAPRN